MSESPDANNVDVVHEESDVNVAAILRYGLGLSSSEIAERDAHAAGVSEPRRQSHRRDRLGPVATSNTTRPQRRDQRSKTPSP